MDTPCTLTIVEKSNDEILAVCQNVCELDLYQEDVISDENTKLITDKVDNGLLLKAVSDCKNIGSFKVLMFRICSRQTAVGIT